MPHAELPEFETTLAEKATLRGVGLHSGVPVEMTVGPGAAGTGIVFVRTDLEDFEIPADTPPDQVSQVPFEPYGDGWPGR